MAEVPNILVHGTLPAPQLDNEQEFQRAVRTWAASFRAVERDEYDILPALPILALAWRRIRNTSSDNHSTEHAQRSWC